MANDQNNPAFERIEQEIQNNETLELVEPEIDSNAPVETPTEAAQTTTSEQPLVVDQEHANKDDFERSYDWSNEYPDTDEDRRRHTKVHEGRRKHTKVDEGIRRYTFVY